MVLGHKYFTKNHQGSHDIFSVTTCEKCQCECEAPNTVGSPDSARKLKSFGLVERVKPASDLMWCDELEMATCNNCYIEES